jgi:formimidoylglutamate deiminase
VAGARRVSEGQHVLHDAAAQAFVAARSATIAPD